MCWRARKQHTSCRHWVLMLHPIPGDSSPLSPQIAGLNLDAKHLAHLKQIMNRNVSWRLEMTLIPTSCVIFIGRMSATSDHTSNAIHFQFKIKRLLQNTWWNKQKKYSESLEAPTTRNLWSSHLSVRSTTCDRQLSKNVLWVYSNYMGNAKSKKLINTT